jgi:hypothetical protein
MRLSKRLFCRNYPLETLFLLLVVSTCIETIHGFSIGSALSKSLPWLSLIYFPIYFCTLSLLSDPGATWWSSRAAYDICVDGERPYKGHVEAAWWGSHTSHCMWRGNCAAKPVPWGAHVARISWHSGADETDSCSLGKARILWLLILLWWRILAWRAVEVNE